MRSFYQLLVNGLIVATKNNFVWFALTFWVYLETKSVISTSLVGGFYMVASALSSFWIGSVVDNHTKKNAMIGSSIVSLMCFGVGLLIYQSAAAGALSNVASPLLWFFAAVLLIGVLAGSIYQIAIPTLISILVPTEMHARANGMFGTIFGISFAITSVASGIVLGLFGMYWVLVIAIVFTLIALAHLLVVKIDEKGIVHTQEETQQNKKIDIKGTIKVIKSIPGLFPLIFLTTFNNLLGGVFMALMDAYGLSLVSVERWGVLWGALSFGFILGGAYISKKGLGDEPLKNLFKIYIVLWITTMFFTIQPSLILLSIGALIWMSFVPFIEATEQTIIQKVVPVQRQGRVFGFAHSVEQAATPFSAFAIGPVAQYIFIPFMTTGAGVELIGHWFGVGEGRGIALVFTAAGFIGLCVTLFARRLKAYKLLEATYKK